MLTINGFLRPGLAVSLNIHLPDFQNFAFFQYQIIYDLEEKFVQIYLPDGQFYLPRAVGQWDMSSPGDTHLRPVWKEVLKISIHKINEFKNHL